MGVGDKALTRRLVGLAACAIGMVPVHQRVVEAYSQAFRARRFHVLPYQVPSRTLLGRAIVRQLGIEHAEAFVVLGGHHHVFLPGASRQLGPLPCRVRLGIEVLGQQLILRNGNTFHLHAPLMLTDHAVQSPVDEHPEPGRMPPCHSLLAGGRLFAFGLRGRGASLGGGHLRRHCRRSKCPDFR